MMRRDGIAHPAIFIKVGVSRKPGEAGSAGQGGDRENQRSVAGGGPNAIPETSGWIGCDDPIQNGNTQSVKEQVLMILLLQCAAMSAGTGPLAFLNRKMIGINARQISASRRKLSMYDNRPACC